MDNPLSNRTTSKSKGYSLKTTPSPKKNIAAALNRRSSTKYPRKSVTTTKVSPTMAPITPETTIFNEMAITTMLPLVTSEHPIVLTTLDTTIPSSTTAIEAETQTISEEYPLNFQIIVTTVAPIVEDSSEQKTFETVTLATATNMVNIDENISDEVTLLPNVEENSNFR